MFVGLFSHWVRLILEVHHKFCQNIFFRLQDCALFGVKVVIGEQGLDAKIFLPPVGPDANVALIKAVAELHPDRSDPWHRRDSRRASEIVRKGVLGALRSRAARDSRRAGQSPHGCRGRDPLRADRPPAAAGFAVRERG